MRILELFPNTVPSYLERERHDFSRNSVTATAVTPGQGPYSFIRDGHKEFVIHWE